MPTDHDDPRDEEVGEPRDVRVVERAKGRVKTPAIILLIVGAIGGIVSLLNVPSIFTLDAQLEQVEVRWDNDPNLKAQQKQEMKQMLANVKGPIKIVLPLSIAFGLFTSALTIFASIRIMSLKSRGLGVFASVVSMFPILSGCCCLGLPVGIWVLIVLSNSEVKAGFAAVARGLNPHDSFGD